MFFFIIVKILALLQRAAVTKILTILRPQFFVKYEVKFEIFC